MLTMHFLFSRKIFSKFQVDNLGHWPKLTVQQQQEGYKVHSLQTCVYHYLDEVPLAKTTEVFRTVQQIPY